MLLWHLAPALRHSLKVPEFLNPDSLAPSSLFPPWQVLFLAAPEPARLRGTEVIQSQHFGKDWGQPGLHLGFISTASLKSRGQILTRNKPA